MLTLMFDHQNQNQYGSSCYHQQLMCEVCKRFGKKLWFVPAHKILKTECQSWSLIVSPLIMNNYIKFDKD